MSGRYDEKGSSTTAKTALGFGIAGTALGLMKGNNCGGGLLGNLFGGNCNDNGNACYENSPRAVYDLEQARAGNEARTELYMLEKHILPIMNKQAEMDKQIAVNGAEDKAAFTIQTLMTDAKIEKATCGVVRGQLYLNPNQMADPYTGGYNEIVSRHYPRPFGGCNDDCGHGCR